MAGINRTVDTDTLTHLAQLADGWLNLMSAGLRPMAIIEMLKDEHPEHAIEFLRSMCNSYCDQIKVAVMRGKPRVSDEWARPGFTRIDDQGPLTCVNCLHEMASGELETHDCTGWRAKNGPVRSENP